MEPAPFCQQVIGNHVLSNASKFERLDYVVINGLSMSITGDTEKLKNTPMQDNRSLPHGRYSGRHIPCTSRQALRALG